MRVQSSHQRPPRCRWARAGVRPPPRRPTIKPAGPAGEGPSLRKATLKPNAPAEGYDSPPAAADGGERDGPWVADLVPRGLTTTAYALGVVGIIPCIQRRYLHLEEERGQEAADGAAALARRKDDVFPQLLVVQGVIYVAATAGVYLGVTGAVRVGRNVVMLIYFLCLFPVLVLVGLKTARALTMPRLQQKEPRNAAYYGTLLAIAVETVQLSALAFNSAGRANNPLSALTLDTDHARAQQAVFWLAVLCVACWLLTVNVASYLSKKTNETQGVAWVAGTTDGLNLLFITLSVSIMRGMNCNAAAGRECWSGQHVLLLAAGTWAMNHLFTAVMVFSTVVSSSLAKYPPRGDLAAQYPAESPVIVPWFSVVDRLGKFVCCAVAVFGPDDHRNAPLVPTFLIVHVALLALSRRGDRASYTSLYHTAGPCTPPSLNVYLSYSYLSVVWCACLASAHSTNALFSLPAALFLACVGWGGLYALLLSYLRKLALARSGNANSPFGRVTVHVDGAQAVTQQRDVSLTEVDGHSNVDDGWHACDDQEAEEDYCPGGYHRVAHADTYQSYQVIAKLGWGQFSTVWLVRHMLREGELSALKICKATQEFRAASMHEIEILQGLSKRMAAVDDPSQACVIKLFDHFEIKGPNGVHVTMAMELLGPNLLKMISNADFKGIDLNIVRILTKNILKGLKFLDEAGVIHTDLKPENVLLEVQDDAMLTEIAKYSNTPPADLARQQATNRDILHGRVALTHGESLAAALERCYTVKITDFGAARWDSMSYPVATVQTREYRSPEVLLGTAKLTTKIDMWSLACITFELVTGDFLFDPKRQKDIDMDIYHWMLFQRLIGDVPTSMSSVPAKYQSRYFDAKGSFKHGALAPVPLGHYIHTKYLMHIEAAEQLAAFLTPILIFDPAQRATAAETLADPWLDVVC